MYIYIYKYSLYIYIYTCIYIKTTGNRKIAEDT